MTHWTEYARRAQIYGPPLRPAPDAVMVTQEAVGTGRGTVLLLGVTPELASAFDDVIAVDKNQAMIDTAWPGDTRAKSARCADWLEMDLPPGSVRAVVGDGSLNNLPTIALAAAVMQRSQQWLIPGGRFVCRVFERPDIPFGTADLHAYPDRSPDRNFHALKWMIAMTLAQAGSATVAVEDIRAAFNDLFPDRDRLAAATGWHPAVIDTIDVYENSPLAYCFPNRAELRLAIPRDAKDIRFLASGRYPLSERCPLVCFTR